MVCPRLRAQAFESGGKIVSSSSVEYTGIYRYEHYDNTFFDMSVSVDFFDDYFLISAEAVDPSAWLLSSGVLASGIHSNLLFNVSFSGVEFTNVKASLDWGLTSPYSSEYFNDTGLMSISYNGTETTVATLDVKRDGSTLGFRVSEVPLPPSILLFTSSLIVLLGFKRSKKIS